MEKFLETFLYSMIAFLILLVIAFIGDTVLFVVTDIGKPSVVVALLLMFALIFMIIYHLLGV